MPNLVWKLFLGLKCSALTFLHTIGLLWCQGTPQKYKRLTKVGKDKSKARDWRI